MNRLDSYARNMVDFHLVIDLVPTLSALFFSKKLDAVMRFGYAQASILLGIGLQFKRVDDLIKEQNSNSAEILAKFRKIVKKFANVFKKLYEEEVKASLPQVSKSNPIVGTNNALKESMGDELEAAGQVDDGTNIKRELKEMRKKIEKSRGSEKKQHKRRKLEE